MKNYNTTLTDKQQKFQHYHLENPINRISYRWRNTTSWSKNSDRISEICIFSIRKSFRKTSKRDWRAREKITDATTDQNKRTEVLTNKDDHKRVYKEIFDRVVKERFDETKIK